MERDQNGKRTQVPSQIEARSTAETCSMDSHYDVELVWTQPQLETQTQQETPIEHRILGETLEAQINTQRERRRYLRQVHKDMVSSINAFAVVLVLLASVTFTGFLQPPGGLDDDGHLKQQGGIMKLFIFYITAAFYLAVVGILICMSCIAFVLPRATSYAGRFLIPKRDRTYSSVGPGLNFDEQSNLNFEVKTNDKCPGF